LILLIFFNFFGCEPFELEIYPTYSTNIELFMNRPPVVKKLCSIPVDIHRWLEERAAATLAPTNSVIVAICRGAMDADRQVRSAGFQAGRAEAAVD
jgi:hypothetical protein